MDNALIFGQDNPIDRAIREADAKIQPYDIPLHSRAPFESVILHRISKGLFLLDSTCPGWKQRFQSSFKQRPVLDMFRSTKCILGHCFGGDYTTGLKALGLFEEVDSGTQISPSVSGSSYGFVILPPPVVWNLTGDQTYSFLTRIGSLYGGIVLSVLENVGVSLPRVCTPERIPLSYHVRII